MMDNTPELFRESLKEFKAADALLSSQLKLHEDTASTEQDITTRKVNAAQQIATGYSQQIEGKKSFSDLSRNFQISPEIDSELEALKSLTADINQREQELTRLEKEITGLKKEFQETLAYEEAVRAQAKRDHMRRNLAFASFVVLVLLAAIFLHFQLLKKTTLSFELSLAGKPLPSSKVPTITLDDKPFASGDKIKLGHHHLSASLQDAGTIQLEFWVFYGAKNLGTLAFESFKGSLKLLSDPSDAEFELSGDMGQHWQGKLPIQIDAVPVGVYQLTVRRKGWELNEKVTVSRGEIPAYKVIFPYGSIEVSSEPAGLVASVNGVEIGKTPTTFREVKPGDYKVTVTDGENDLMADISIAPKEAAKHPFIFHYSSVQLSSTPAGATVIRKGKEIGKTPLTLDHIPAGETMVELRLQDYVSTNLLIHAVENVTTELSAKLISERYLQAMKQARKTLNAGQFTESQKFLSAALGLEPNDLAARELQNEIYKAVAKAEAAQKEIDRRAEAARKEADQQLIMKKQLEYEELFQQILAATKGTGMFADHVKKYSSDFDRVWGVITTILKQQGDTLVDTKLQEGIIVTARTRHGIIGLPHFDRYLLQLERIDNNTTKVHLKLMIYWQDFDGKYGEAGNLQPEQGEYVQRQAEKFFDKIGRGLNTPQK